MSRRRSAVVTSPLSPPSCFPAVPLACGGDRELDAGQGRVRRRRDGRRRCCWRRGGWRRRHGRRRPQALARAAGPAAVRSTGTCSVRPRSRSTAPPGATDVRVPGEWNGFDLGAAPQLQGRYAGPARGHRRPAAGAARLQDRPIGQGAARSRGCSTRRQGRPQVRRRVENSAVKVPDCRLPSFSVASSQAPRPAWARAPTEPRLGYRTASKARAQTAAAFEAVLQDQDGASRPLTDQELSVDARGNVRIQLGGLGDGKCRVASRPGQDASGRAGEPLRLVFWVEAETFSWEDALIYMVGHRSLPRRRSGLEPAPHAGRRSAGRLVRRRSRGPAAARSPTARSTRSACAAICTPFQTNPAGAYLASDGVHMVTGYHGYWPVKGREVDPRLGGEAALRAVVTEAHQHGIRVLQDFVVNHVHEDHEYVVVPPGVVPLDQGASAAPTTATGPSHALDCMFASYLPDMDHTRARGQRRVRGGCDLLARRVRSRRASVSTP